MDIDELNNSQMLLLVLLVAIVTSVALSVATLALLLDRINLPQSETPEQKTTVIEKTINTIIEKSVGGKIKESDEISTPTSDLELENLGDALDIFETVHFGTTAVANGFFITDTGILVTPTKLTPERRYSIQQEERDVYFDVLNADTDYSVLQPVEEYNAEQYFTQSITPELALGDSIVLYGGVGDEVQVHLEHIVQIVNNADGVRQIKTSLQADDIPNPSFAYSKDTPIGVVLNQSPWVLVLSDLQKLYNNDTQPQ